MSEKPVFQFMVSSNTGEIVVSQGTPPPGWIPEGWAQMGPNRWVPQWPACGFRRLSVTPKVDAPPEIVIHCLEPKQHGKPQSIVSQPICQSCKLFKIVADPHHATLTPAQVQQLLGRSSDVLPPGDGDYQAIDASQHPLVGLSPDELDALEDVVFHDHMDMVPTPAKLTTNFLHLRWDVPCKFRAKVPKVDADCKGCGSDSIVCQNPDAELFNQVVTRRKCKACPCPQPPLNEPT